MYYIVYYITTLPKTEIEKVSKQFSADTGYTFNGKLLRTVDDCVEQYKKADEVSKIAQMVIRDRMQGDALLKAKKLMMPDHWNVDVGKMKASTVKNAVMVQLKKFQSFLSLIKCSGQQASYLLDFAGYKEAEQALIDEGVEVTPQAIEKAKHKEVSNER